MYRVQRSFAYCPCAAPPSRRGLAVLPIVLTLLIVALATLSVGSTIVARRAMAQRDQARQDFAQAMHGYDAMVEAVAMAKPFKKELLEPAASYYQQFAQEHANDKHLLAELASARFHLAALRAKMGSKEGVAAMNAGLNDLDALAKDETADPVTFPSLQDSALKLTTPVEWFMVKGADQAYGISLILAISRATTTYENLSRKHPSSISFRDNYAALLKGSALLQTQLPNGRERSLESWLKARDVLETLVRDQPASSDFQARLAESLLNSGKLQKTDKQNAQAEGNFKRAVAVREQMLAAKPEDKTLQSDLKSAQRELDRLAADMAKEPAKTEPAKPETPAAEGDASAEPKPPAAEQAAATATPSESADAADAPAATP